MGSGVAAGGLAGDGGVAGTGVPVAAGDGEAAGTGEPEGGGDAGTGALVCGRTGDGEPGTPDGIADGSSDGDGEGEGLGVMQGGVSTIVLYLPLFVVTFGAGVAAASHGTAAA